MKITIVGAGGHVFPFRLVVDLLSFPALRDCDLCLMDIDPDRLALTANAVRRLVGDHRLPTRVEATTDRRHALEGSAYVFVTFQVGGLEAYRLDTEIPRRYGIDQTVGDTLGPGGVMRFLRTSVALRDLATDLLEVAPNALVLNYANPMAMNCLFLSHLGVKTVGLCHSVQNTTQMLARTLGVPYSEVRYLVGGINHQAWVLEFARGTEDLMPSLRRTLREKHLERMPRAALRSNFGDHSYEARDDSNYEGGQERVRTQIMASFGFFHTESSHHASEYLPYFRKTPMLAESYLPNRWDYYQLCCIHEVARQNGETLEQPQTLEPSLEYGARIINAIATDTPEVIYGNVPNHGLIDNLPQGCCVEVACLVDANGVQPQALGPLPPQLAALNRTNIGVQELAAQAALTLEREHVYHALALDPLTGTILTLEGIDALTDDLLTAQAGWLPVFQGQPRTQPQTARSADAVT
jgi:alpha-galactosidase